MINHEMQNYDFIEATAFSGLMPCVIEKTQGIGVTDNDQVVKFHGVEARGVDPMEVVDVEYFFDEEGGNEGEGGDSSESGETVNP